MAFRIHVGQCEYCGRRAQGRHAPQTSNAAGGAASPPGARTVPLARELNKGLGLSHSKTAAVLEGAFGQWMWAGVSAKHELQAPVPQPRAAEMGPGEWLPKLYTKRVLKRFCRSSWALIATRAARRRSTPPGKPKIARGLMRPVCKLTGPRPRFPKRLRERYRAPKFSRRPTRARMGGATLSGFWAMS